MSQINHIKFQKRVLVALNTITYFKKTDNVIVEELKRKITDLYHMPFQTLAPIFNLIH